MFIPTGKAQDENQESLAPPVLPVAPAPANPLMPSPNVSPSRSIPPTQFMNDVDIREADPNSPYLRTRLPVVPTIQNQSQQALAIANSAAAAVAATTPASTLIPQAASAVSASENPYKAVNTQQLYSLVSVSFFINPTDVNFGYVDIWVTGYHGNKAPVLVASGTPSPVSFLLETTGETITIYVVTVSPTGATAGLVTPFSRPRLPGPPKPGKHTPPPPPNSPQPPSPNTTVVLNGVATAPPAPSIAQLLVATITGYQFQFNFETGLLADVIDGYNVYRNTTNTSGTATKIAYIKQNATNTGVYTFQDVVPAVLGQNYYYWVSAVNKKGLESALTSAQSGAVANSSLQGGSSTGLGNQGSLVASFDNSHFSWSTTSTSISFWWIAFNIPKNDGTSYAIGALGSSGSPAITISGLTASTTYYLYCYYTVSTGVIHIVLSDLSSGTAPASTAFIVQTLNGDGNVPVWGTTIATPASGTGGGGGAPGGGKCFSGNVRVRIVDSNVFRWKRFDELPAAGKFKIVNMTGVHFAELVVHESHVERMIDMGDGLLVTGSHLMRNIDGEWVPACELFPDQPRVDFDGTVYNLHVLSDKEEDRHYVLENFEIAHNTKFY